MNSGVSVLCQHRLRTDRLRSMSASRESASLSRRSALLTRRERLRRSCAPPVLPPPASADVAHSPPCPPAADHGRACRHEPVLLEAATSVTIGLVALDRRDGRRCAAGRARSRPRVPVPRRPSAVPDVLAVQSPSRLRRSCAVAGIRRRVLVDGPSRSPTPTSSATPSCSARLRPTAGDARAARRRGPPLQRQHGRQPAAPRSSAGLAAITAFAAVARCHRDTRLDRWEPDLNEAIGPVTSATRATPDDIATALLRAASLEDAAGVLASSRLREWMLRNDHLGRTHARRPRRALRARRQDRRRRVRQS